LDDLVYIFGVGHGFTAGRNNFFMIYCSTILETKVIRRS
jgi:hypothetical protein